MDKSDYGVKDHLKDIFIAAPSVLLIAAAVLSGVFIDHWMRFVVAAALGLPGIFLLLRIVHRAKMQLGLTGRNTEVEKRRIEEFKRAWAKKDKDKNA